MAVLSRRRSRVGKRALPTRWRSRQCRRNTPRTQPTRSKRIQILHQPSVGRRTSPVLKQREKRRQNQFAQTATIRMDSRNFSSVVLLVVAFVFDFRSMVVLLFCSQQFYIAVMGIFSSTSAAPRGFSGCSFTFFLAMPSANFMDARLSKRDSCPRR